jgi:hypothetical protein
MRHDHTKWLIHFVRDRVPEQDFPGEAEEEADFYAGGELEYDADAFSVLKTIIRLGGLFPGYSFRSGRTTIYGGQPAICATEMPLYSFAVYARDRSNTGKVSAYGLAFLKSEFYEAGGRPVIYGLSVDSVSYVKNEASCRIIDPNVLPLAEQYRYVAYNPSSLKWLDWSHEREWRWIVQNENHDYVWCRDANGGYGPAPGLPLFRGSLDGGFFSVLCIIVWNSSEAREIQELLTGFYLAGSNNYDTPFDRNLISRSSIIVLEDVVAAVEHGQDLSAQTIEGLQKASLVKPILLSSPPPDASARVAAALASAVSAGERAATNYLAKHPLDKGSCGYADAVTYEVVDPLVQYMLANGLASGPFDGRVHIKVKESWPLSQLIDYNEHVYSAVADALSTALGIKVWMHSNLD